MYVLIAKHDNLLHLYLADKVEFKKGVADFALPYRFPTSTKFNFLSIQC